MKITLADVTVEIPNADPDGIHTFELSDSFWALWHKEKGLCKAFGFYIEKRRPRWVGIYKPYARFTEGSKRLQKETYENETERELRKTNRFHSATDPRRKNNRTRKASRDA